MKMVLDVETTNSTQNGKVSAKDSLVYDCGFCILDDRNNIVDTKSFVVYDIFFDRPELMEVAFFKEKIPQYLEEIQQGKRVVVSFYDLRKKLFETISQYDIEAISCHNAYFDYTALTSTQRYLTKSKYRFFFPHSVEIWDTLKMAKELLLKDDEYFSFCAENEYLTEREKPKLTAEVLYRYFTQDKDFVESHTGAEDSIIESEILKQLLKRKPLHKKLWEN